VPLISRRSLDTGRSSSSNLVGETRVPRNAPGTPQANACFPSGAGARGGTSDSAGAPGRAVAQNRGARGPKGGLGERGKVGLGGETRWAWGETGWAWRQTRAASGEREDDLGRARGWARGEREGGLRKKVKSPGHANTPLAPGRSGRPSGPTVRSGRPRRRHRNAGADPLGHRFMESAITRELRRARTSAPPRTPRRCWPEYARAH